MDAGRGLFGPHGPAPWLGVVAANDVSQIGGSQMKISEPVRSMKECISDCGTRKMHRPSHQISAYFPLLLRDNRPTMTERSGIPPSSARALSRRLVEAGMLRTIEPASGRRAAMYAFDPLLDLLKV